MKLIQLNAWGGRLEPQIGDFLEAEAPDILCLQEAISFSSKGSGLFITIESIQERFNLPFISFGPVFSFRFMNRMAQFGNCVLSRHPITETEVVFTHLEHKSDFIWGEHSANMRNFVHSTIDVNGTMHNVLTHHGFWIPDHKNGNHETVDQMKKIANYVKKLDGPVILTGDFNLAPDSESLKELNMMLSNLCVKNGLKTTRTGLTYKTEVCDYIFVNEQVGVKDFRPLDKVVSDHQALLLDFA